MRGYFLKILKVMMVFLPITIGAQLNEDFSDGDFTSNPQWNGDIANFIINASNEIQLNAPSVTDISYLSTETGILDFSDTIIWNFRMNMLFSPSSNNTGRFYLSSNFEDLKGSLNGYYIKIGESGAVDKIKLYRQDGISSSSDDLICSGSFGAYGVNPNARIRVVRDIAGNWLIEADSTGNSNFILEGGGTDATYQFSKYAGIWCKYTSSNSTKFIFDDISIEANIIVDNDPPVVVSAVVSGTNLIDLVYNEQVTNSAEDILNYFLSGGNDQPLIVQNNSNVYQLMFNTPFSSGETYSLNISNIEDLSNNFLNTSVNIVVPDTAKTGEIIINEILFNPFTGASDYLELYNNSEKTIDLYNYFIADYDDGIDNFKKVEEHFILAPNQYVLFTEDSLSTASEYNQRDASVFIEMDLPTFPNDSATVYVLNPDSLVLDYFSYNDDMHFTLINDAEGVSLERINANSTTNNATNWHSAAESSGWGTPGLENSQNFTNTASNLFFNVETLVFSPDNDGFEDIAIFSFELDAPGYVANLVVYDNLGRLITRLFENELLSKSGTTTWDGTMENGEKARIGIYLLYFEVFDLTGNVHAVKKTITLKGRL
jgi:hypothetical protein